MNAMLFRTLTSARAHSRSLLKRSKHRVLRGLRSAALLSWRTAPDLTSAFIVNACPRVIPRFATYLEQNGDFHAALALTRRKTLAGRQPVASAALCPRFLAKLERWPDLKQWYYQNCETIARAPLSKQSSALRLMVLRVSDMLGIQKIRPSLLQRALSDMNSPNRREARAARRILLSNRIYGPLEDDIFRKGTCVEWAKVGPAIQARQLSRDIDDWVDIASENELRLPDERLRVPQDEERGDPIEVFIPIHFFSQWDQKRGGSRQANWSEIRTIFTELSRTMKSLRVPIQPRHQYFMNFAAPSETMPALTFFSNGGSPLNWHMRDVGIRGFVSIDPDGYWGHSSISIADISEGLAGLDVAQDEIDDAVRVAQTWFGGSGGNKYAIGPDRMSAEIVDPKSIFVPLQSPGGLEATERRVEELIDLVAAYSKETQTTVYLRRHPLDTSPLVTKAIETAVASTKCVVSEISPWLLSASTAATVSLNSATIMQAVVAGRPVFTWGRSDVHSVATDIGDYQTFKTNMNAVLCSETARDDLQRRFVYFYLRRYLINVGDARAVEERLRLIADLSGSASSDDLRRRFLDRLF